MSNDTTSQHLDANAVCLCDRVDSIAKAETDRHHGQLVWKHGESRECLCKVCGAIASHKFIKLSEPCGRPIQQGEYHMKGNKVLGFLGWPYKSCILWKK